ncbi:hypothetical protein ABZT04_33045 [Streptomyces sp. NPDC005492]|uniref:hypothetical protein n=1 Tax=Streptomyces sp. NPDC005492 TaxID=3156883 RepID=UPI0033B0BB41
MTTSSFSPSPDRPEIPRDSAADPLVPAEGAYIDPMHSLVHAAVADRPLDEVLQLITLLEQSPQYAQATADALRAVGVSRSVEDVTRLVSLLTEPPRDPDCADEAIRAAAENRPVEDVTRLMALLHRAPLEPHCGEEAVRAAAGRPVEELVELIGRLAEEQSAPARTLGVVSDQSPAPDTLLPEPPWHAPAAPYGPEGTDERTARQRPPRRRPSTATRRVAPEVRPRLMAAVALVLCGLSYFPLHRGGASADAYGFALGVSILCVLLAPVLILRGSLSVLSLSMAVPAALAAIQLFDGRVHSTPLSEALRITAAPAWLAGLMAVLAALAALTALLALLASRRFGRQLGLPEPPDHQPLAGAGRTPQ